jgi:hypothetical protein
MEMIRMNPVVHFEMPAKDTKRTAAFYSGVFGWNMIQMDEKMGNYLLAHTTETSPDGMVKIPGNINGGFFPISEKSGNLPSVVISVENLEEHKKKVIAAGGQIVGEQMDIPGVGLFTSFMDTEGNKVGMLQPKRS